MKASPPLFGFFVCKIYPNLVFPRAAMKLLPVGSPFPLSLSRIAWLLSGCSFLSPLQDSWSICKKRHRQSQKVERAHISMKKELFLCKCTILVSVKELSAEWEFKLFNKELSHQFEYPLKFSIFEQCDLYLTTHLVYLFKLGINYVRNLNAFHPYSKLKGQQHSKTIFHDYSMTRTCLVLLRSFLHNRKNCLVPSQDWLHMPNHMHPSVSSLLSPSGTFLSHVIPFTPTNFSLNLFFF